MNSVNGPLQSGTARRAGQYIVLLILMMRATTISAAEPQPGEGETLPAVAIIIDDIGYNYALGEQAVSLPGKLNFGILPFTPFGRELALMASANGQELLLHAPMSNTAGEPLGEGGLTPQLNEDEFRQVLERSLESIPELRGLNNHMGSELTTYVKQMTWVMQELRERKLYFVDSRTTADSVAADVAMDNQVPTLTRQVFLDNEQLEDRIAERFEELLRIARHNGLAVGIGHPYPATLTYLKKRLPQLAAEGVKLILISDALKPENQVLPDNHSVPADLSPNEPQYPVPP